MIKRDFIQLARLVKDNTMLADFKLSNNIEVLDKAKFVNQLIEFLEADNPRFDSDKFREATK